MEKIIIALNLIEHSYSKANRTPNLIEIQDI